MCYVALQHSEAFGNSTAMGRLLHPSSIPPAAWQFTKLPHYSIYQPHRFALPSPPKHQPQLPPER